MGQEEVIKGEVHQGNAFIHLAYLANRNKLYLEELLKSTVARDLNLPKESAEVQKEYDDLCDKLHKSAWEKTKAILK